MRLLMYLMVAMIMASCKNEVPHSLKVKPVALGVMNEIVVVSDMKLWESEVKDSFQYYFASAYPIMPRPEPFFDLRHFTVEDLQAEPLRKELRTYLVLADLSDADSPTTKMFRQDIGEDRYKEALADTSTNSSIGRDKWARKQIVFYLFGNGRDELYKAIRDNFSSVAKRVHLHDTEQLNALVYARPRHKGFEKRTLELYGVTMKIPGEYREAKYNEENKFLWLRKDEKNAAMSIIMKEIDYSSQDQFTPEYMKGLRDEIGKQVSGDSPGSYMITNDKDLPLYDYTRDLNGQYCRELRGVWEMVDEFMGGPFASYLIHNKETNKLLFIDTWVYAPGDDKRNFMQQMEHIVKGAKY